MCNFRYVLLRLSSERKHSTKNSILPAGCFFNLHTNKFIECTPLGIVAWSKAQEAIFFNKKYS